MSKLHLVTRSDPFAFYAGSFDGDGQRRTLCLDRAAARQLVDELDRWLTGLGEEREEREQKPFCEACTGYAYHYPDCARHPANAKPDSLPVAEVRQVLESVARWTEGALGERDEARAAAQEICDVFYSVLPSAMEQFLQQYCWLKHPEREENP